MAIDYIVERLFSKPCPGLTNKVRGGPYWFILEASYIDDTVP